MYRTPPYIPTRALVTQKYHNSTLRKKEQRKMIASENISPDCLCNMNGMLLRNLRQIVCATL
jgi:hypothetical protein